MKLLSRSHFKRAAEPLCHWLLTLLELGQPGQAYKLGSDEVINVLMCLISVRGNSIGLSVTVPLADAIRRMSVLR